MNFIIGMPRATPNSYPRCSRLALLLFAGGCVSSAPGLQVNAPLRYTLSDQKPLNDKLLQDCFQKHPSIDSAEVSVFRYSPDEYLVQIRGQDMMLSNSQSGIWEEVGYFILALPADKRTILLLTGMRGKSTFSRAGTAPPSGDRWRPFNDQQHALMASRTKLIFSGVGRCIGQGKSAA